MDYHNSGNQVESNKRIRVAVVGQPNVGKSTLFNVLTNNKVHVANWPGVTVEKHYGTRRYRDREIEFVDLPGIYGFSSLTLEERIARSYILSGEPDVLLVLVDSLNPERTMYLAVQALELTPNTILVFTKADATHARGIHINYEKLQRKLGVPVVSVSAATGQGIEELLDLIVASAEKEEKKEPIRIDYHELNPYIESIEKILSRYAEVLKYPIRWIAVRLLEGDHELEDYIRKQAGEEVLDEVASIRREAATVLKRDPVEIASIRRFEFISSILGEVVVKTELKHVPVSRLTRLFYNPVIGSLLGIAILALIFTIVFMVNTGFPLNALFEALGYSELATLVEEYSLSRILDYALNELGNVVYDAMGDTMLAHLVVDGILGGVGAVLVFLPLIAIVSLALALLEDSGIAPRIAVGVHNLLAKIGVSGHAVFPITLGLGCNVPAILSTRGLPDPRERLRLILTLPFIPCQARLVVLLALASAFSRYSGGLLLLSGYLISFFVFASVNRVLYEIDRRKGRAITPEMLLEIPPIHRPIPRVIWWLTWNSTKHFLVKAGVIIFSLSIVAWTATSYTFSLTYTSDPSESIAAAIARSFAPLLSPIDLPSTTAWIVSLALIAGFIAKEIIISTLLIATGADSVRNAIELIWLSDAQIASIAMFTVLYVPCLATLAVIHSETKSLKYTLLAVLLMMVIGYASMVVTYWIASAIM